MNLKKKLLEGEPLYGLWLGLADSYAAEVCVGSGADWMLIDALHAPNTIRSVHEQLRILDSSTEVVIRTADNNPTQIQHYLDLGARNLLIPGVRTPEQARSVVAATRYAPIGNRSVASTLNKAASFGRSTSYLRTVHQEICLFIQIDSIPEPHCLEQMAAVLGIEGMFISPGDIAASMGHLGNPRHPQVREAIEGLLNVIQSHGTYTGIYASSAADGLELSRMGASLIAIGSDVGVLKRGVHLLFSETRGERRGFSDQN